MVANFPSSELQGQQCGRADAPLATDAGVSALDLDDKWLCGTGDLAEGGEEPGEGHQLLAMQECVGTNVGQYGSNIA